MAPRSHTLPQASTDSAREARKAFFCEDCQKGYTRTNELEAHLSSYDHLHRKRLKEMRQLTKDPNAAAKARAAEQNATELRSIAIPSLPASTAGKKRPVFKSTLQPHNAAELGPIEQPATATKREVEDDNDADPSFALANGWYEDRYEPRFVTGCDDAGCQVCKDGVMDLGPCDGEVETIVR